MKAFLDTHAAVLLWSGEPPGRKATDLLEGSAIFYSPIVLLELQFLRGIGRLEVSPEEILGGLGEEMGAVASEEPLQAVVSRAIGLEWTRDPFDRWLVATAMLHKAPFVTRDERILEHFDAALW